MSKPLVSVLCLTFNHEKYIKQCLESMVTQQTNFTFEILVGDDASTDSTRKIIKSYEERYPEIIKPVFRKKNIGVFRNWLDLYSKSSGKYIALCEGDDFWIDPLKLKKQQKILENNQQASATYHRVNISKNNHLTDKIFPRKTVDYNNISSFLGDFYKIPTCSVMFKDSFRGESLFKYRTLLRSGGYIWDFLLDSVLASKGSYIGLDDIMASYRVTYDSDSFSSQRVEVIEESMLAARDSVDRFFLFEYTNLIKRGKNIVTISILLKYFRQQGIYIMLKKASQMSVREFLSLVITATLYTFKK